MNFLRYSELDETFLKLCYTLKKNQQSSRQIADVENDDAIILL